MLDVKHLSRGKKCFLFFSLLISLFCINISIFSVRASANAISDPSRDQYLYVIGMPVDVYLQTRSGNFDYYTVLPNVSLFYDAGSANASWAEGFTTANPLVNLSYRGQDLSIGYDLTMSFPNGNAFLRSVEANTPVFGDSFDAFNDYGGYFAVSSAQGSFQVYYDYTVLCAEMRSDGSIYWRYDTISGFVTITPLPNNNNIANIPLFHSSLITQDAINEYSAFEIDGKKQMMITQIIIDFNKRPLYENILYYTDTHEKPLLMTEFKSHFAYDLRQAITNDVAVVKFSDISWTDWLVSSVGGFMNFEIVPGLSIGGMLGLLVGMSLFIVFLKVFAGG